MFSLNTLSSQQDLAIWSVNLIAKALVIMAVTFVVLWLLRRSSSALRHQVIAIAMVFIFMLPLLSLIVPEWNLNSFGFFEAPAADYPALEGGAVTAPTSDLIETPAARGWNLTTWLLVIWLAGTALMLLRLIAGRLLGMRMLLNTQRVEDERLNRLLNAARDYVDVNMNVTLLASDDVKVPVIYGILFPRLIVPADAADWTDERLEAVFIHELSHIKRLDILTQTVAQLVSCIFWFNPAAWVLERRMMIERERACDDMVLIKGKRASEYAKHLMESAGALGNSRNPAWAKVAMAEGTDFKDRVLSILDPNARRSTPRVTVNVIAVLMASLITIPFVAAQPFSRHAADTSDSVRRETINLNGNHKRGRETEKSEVIPSDTEATGDTPARFFHAIGDLVENPDKDEAGKEFAEQLIFSIAELVKEDEEGGEQIGSLLDNLGELIRNSGDSEKARKKAADLIRSIGDITEQERENLMNYVDQEIDKKTKDIN